MSKQLLIYETAVPVSAARHAGTSVEPMPNYAFSAGINAVPLMAVEFPPAASEYAIVFTESDGEVLPAVVLGMHNDQNLYLSADARWQARYIPAFLRRYPFVFSASPDGARLTLCIDETHPSVNRDGRGQRLFDADGKPSAFVAQVLDFLQKYHAQFERTRAFCARIKAFGLLEAFQAQVQTPQGARHRLGGFMAVGREKLRALAPEQLAELAKTDELELLYLHLHSLRNFSEVKDRLLGSLPPEAPAEVQGVAAAA